MSDVDLELRKAINTGKVYLGSKVAIREIRRGRAKMAILSSSCPKKIKNIINNLAELSNIKVIKHKKNSLDLGMLCGKPFPVSVIVINQQGDSKIFEVEV